MPKLRSLILDRIISVIINEFARKKDPSNRRERLCRQLLCSQTSKAISLSSCHEPVLTKTYSKGLKYNHPENSKIDWLVGDILTPEKFLPQINSADIIVHTIGTLFDTSVTKGTKAGGPGTYEQVNRDTFASLLKHLEAPKKVIYLSSNGHPPFLSRYLSTKREAE